MKITVENESQIVRFSPAGEVLFFFDKASQLRVMKNKYPISRNERWLLYYPDADVEDEYKIEYYGTFKAAFEALQERRKK